MVSEEIISRIDKEKKMKKLSLLIALCMLLTIGGVYATWIYSESKIDAQTEPFVSKMGVIGHEGDTGVYTFVNNSLDFAIEPDAQDTKITTLVWGTGSMTLVFTPKSDITDADLARALGATLTVEQASTTLGTYDSTTIYTIDTEFEIVLDAETDWEEHDDGAYYTYTITGEDLEGSVGVNAFHLPTEDEYIAFKAAIQDVKFRVKVTPAA